MEAALVAVSPAADCQLWVERWQWWSWAWSWGWWWWWWWQAWWQWHVYQRFKTGNVPPGEYQFEDLSSSSLPSTSSSANAKTRTLSRVKSPETGAISIFSLISYSWHQERTQTCFQENATWKKESALSRLRLLLPWSTIYQTWCILTIYQTCTNHQFAL